MSTTIELPDGLKIDPTLATSTECRIAANLLRSLLPEARQAVKDGEENVDFLEEEYEESNSIELELEDARADLDTVRAELESLLADIERLETRMVAR